MEAEAPVAGGEVSPWVFPSAAGTPLDLSAVARRFQSLLRAAGLPRYRCTICASKDLLTLTSRP